MEKFIDIIFFAIIAGIILYRLKDTLGDKSGFQGPDDKFELKDVSSSSKEKKEDTVITVPFRKKNETGKESVSAVQKGLESIHAADETFDEEQFMQGAATAFRMVLEAYAKGDKETLKKILSRDVMKLFGAAIDARRRAKQVLESTFERVVSAEILEAHLDRKLATIKVKFVSEHTEVLYDKKGEIIEGNPDEITESTDIWTFQRKVTDPNPNWTLIETAKKDNA